MIADDVLAEAAAAGGEARLLPDAVIAELLLRLNMKYAGSSNPPRPLWEYLLDAPSLHDIDGWRKAAAVCGEGEVYMLVEEMEKPYVLWLASTALLTPILAETVNFVFYLFDDECNYLVCFNDHDMLICAGTAGARLEALHPHE